MHHNGVFEPLKHHAISLRKAACTSWISTGMGTVAQLVVATNAARVEAPTLVSGPGRARLLRVCRT